jgi:putative membrane-bound dehydrogenase-like protein
MRHLTRLRLNPFTDFTAMPEVVIISPQCGVHHSRTASAAGYNSPMPARKIPADILAAIGDVLRAWSRVFLFSCFLPGTLQAAERHGPLAPAESQKKIQLADPELVIELVASEPAINSPVAITWDEAGKMYVVEMSDYPAADTGGRIRQLSDRDGDGVFESATTFADGLKFPTGALPWNGGLLVTSAPDILFFKDTDGDGRADERKVILTGFAEGNQQLRVNGLLWGLDNVVYGANGRSGGAVRRPGDPPDQSVPILRHDFRFDPATGQFEALAGFSQFGLGRDDFNHRFVSWNTVPFRHVVIEERDLSRNPFLTVGQSVAVITDPADTGRVYPISSPPVTFNRERTDYFNASCGLTVFRGAGLGPDCEGNAFVAEPLTNLSHRKILDPQGATFIARRGEHEREFLASRDNWFHPVNLATGPDGCLYLADFYREWVEHPEFVPEPLRKSVDFRTGNEHGRIWRVRRRDFQPRMPAPVLASASPAELVAALGSPMAWTRDTAQRLLVERQEKSVAPALKRLAADGGTPVSRVHALWTLTGLSALTPELVSRALNDRSADVREQAIILLRRSGNRPQEVMKHLAGLARDPAPRVRFQAALAAGDSDAPAALSILAALARQGADDEWQRLAVLSAQGRTAWPFLETLIRESDKTGTGSERRSQTVEKSSDRGAAVPSWLERPTSGEQTLLREAAALIGIRQQEAEIAGLVGLIAQIDSRSEIGAMALLSGLGDGLASRQLPLHRFLADPPAALKPHIPQIERLIALAKTRAGSRAISESQRLLGLRLAVQARPDAARPLIAMLLAAEESPAVQSAAARGLADAGDIELARKVTQGWMTYRINLRRELIGALVRNAELASALIEALESGTIAIAELDLSAREALRRVPAKELQARASKLLKSPAGSDLDAVVAAYQSSLELAGDAKIGAALFARHCLTCHEMQGKGSRVGPDLSGIGSRPKLALVEDILNPGKDVSPDFVNFVVVTKQGRVFTGLLAADTPALVRLRGPQGAEETILRSDIEEVRPNHQSLMPEGFEQALNPQDLSHLLEFLRRPVPLPDR